MKWQLYTLLQNGCKKSCRPYLLNDIGLQAVEVRKVLKLLETIPAQKCSGDAVSRPMGIDAVKYVKLRSLF